MHSKIHNVTKVSFNGLYLAVYVATCTHSYAMDHNCTNFILIIMHPVLKVKHRTTIKYSYRTIIFFYSNINVKQAHKMLYSHDQNIYFHFKVFLGFS